MTTLNIKVSAIIEILESVRKRTPMYIEAIDAKLLEHFLHGFNVGCFALLNDAQAYSRHISMFLRIASERGWDFNALSPVNVMRKKGLSEEEILNELMVLEIKTWHRLCCTNPESPDQK